MLTEVMQGIITVLCYIIAVVIGVVLSPLMLCLLPALYVVKPAFIRNLYGDCSLIWSLFSMRRDIIGVVKKHDEKYTVSDMLADAVRRWPNDEAIVMVSGSDDGNAISWTFHDLDMISNQFANWGLNVGLKKHDCVALCMENCPQYIAFWLGMAKIGVKTSLVNPNIKGTALLHSLNMVEVKIFVVSKELAPSIITNLESLACSTYVFYNDRSDSNVHNIGATIPLTVDAFSNAIPDGGFDRAGIKTLDIFLYIYTSGTTGLPKAVKLNHLRFFGGAKALCHFYGLLSSDRLYCTLPLYHSSACVLGVGASLAVGNTLILRKKFSVSSFWRDCKKYNVSIIQYIGEMCRYLINSPVSKEDQDHSVRAAAGNGMRPDVWGQFQSRFNIPNIYEFYGSTEGNASLINNQNKPGSVGRISPLLAALYPVKIVQVDTETNILVRNSKNVLIECKTDEVGELLGYIDMNDISRRFDGYTDKACTENKIVRNAFKDGDAWFRSGDLMRKDVDGFVYFVDRCGDTFRWKGENVSTKEVELTILEDPSGNILDCSVYGVKVGEQDGRVGMATLVVNSNFDLEEFYHHCIEALPSYQRPAFLLILSDIETTPTFKHKKGDRKKYGFDPSHINPEERLYFRSDLQKVFLPIVDDATYKMLHTGVVRF